MGRSQTTLPLLTWMLLDSLVDIYVSYAIVHARPQLPTVSQNRALVSEVDLEVGP